jgi:hypothetical protein
MLLVAFLAPKFRVDTNVDGRITREEVQEVTLFKHVLNFLFLFYLLSH